MGKVRRPGKVKLFTALLYNNSDSYSAARKDLERHFGKIDFEGIPYEFTHTKYYNDEMGNDLKKVFLSFSGLISLDDIYRVKIKTNFIEERRSIRQTRTVNIDPGYVDMAKLVLFSTKDFSHRIYLRGGIFAEVTLIYMDGRFNPLPWTYPDYKCERSLSDISSIRNIFREQTDRDRS